MIDQPVALITGGGTGVGKACSVRFAEKGYAVIVNYSRSEREATETVNEIAAAGGQARLAQCDVSDNTSVCEMIDQVAAEFGRLDVVVNNAATTNFIPHEKLDELTEEMWDRMMAVNVKGAFFVTRAAAPLLKQSDQTKPQAMANAAMINGAVVNIASVAGLTGSGSSIAYCASKGALITMTKSLARVLAPNVTVNAVCPGPIDSRWIREGNPDWDLNEMVAGYPIPRASQPDDIADAVIYFCTGNRIATGQVLSVDGGQTL